ncbi:MAG: DUF1648 domain-containing protein [Armatimonadota bacterium]|nr:DUF1648 domain-containing protein [Armatimonadota bacterium]
MIGYFRRRCNPQPKIKVEPTPTDQVVEVAAALGAALSITKLLLNWHRVPAMVPTRFDFGGKAVQWGSKNNLLFLCGMIVVFYLVFTILNRFPHTFNYPVPITEENAERQYTIVTRGLRWLKLELVWAYGYLLSATMQVSIDHSLRLSPWFTPVFLGAVFITLSVMLVMSYKAR